MTNPASTAAPDRAAPAVDALVATLQAEADALGELNALLEQQLGALRAGTPAVLEETAVETQRCAATLESLRQKRARQTRLLSRVLQVEADEASLQVLAQALRQRAGADAGTRLADARQTVRTLASDARQRGDALYFALEYAADLNRDLLLTMQGAADQAGGQTTYTAAGRSQSAERARSFLNAVG